MQLCVVLSVSLLIATVIASEDVVMTNYGPVRGLVLPGFRQFQGVPYATPPLGSLRYKYPIPPSPWTTVKDCTNFTIGCAQLGHSLDIPKNVSEDCLYLEIWTPRVGKHAAPASVMVWFYGGDFKEGGESFQLYNGSAMSSTTNTIVVATNYRVGNLGFFFSPNSDPNVGLADQRWTLKWVQQNIASFGGDPKKVSIFGQSAGGESVTIHYSTPKSSGGLFTSAISESGPMSLNFRTSSNALYLADVFATVVGCKLEDLACFQAKPIKEILHAADQAIAIPLDLSEAIMRWAPVITGTDGEGRPGEAKEFAKRRARGEQGVPQVDGGFLQQPLAAFEKGEILKLPLISGSNSEDGVLFGWAISPGILPAYEYAGIVLAMFHDEWVEPILKYYPWVVAGDNRAVLSQLITDYLFGCASRKTLRMAQAAGIRNTYLYQFSRLPNFCPWPQNQQFCCNAVCHGDEIPFVFKDTGYPYPWNMTKADTVLSDAMVAYWTAFAQYGDPNKGVPASVPKWPVYRNATDLSIQLDAPISIVTGLNKKNCDFWDTVGYYHVPRVRTLLGL